MIAPSSGDATGHYIAVICRIYELFDSDAVSRYFELVLNKRISARRRRSDKSKKRNVNLTSFAIIIIRIQRGPCENNTKIKTSENNGYLQCLHFLLHVRVMPNTYMPIIRYTNKLRKYAYYNSGRTTRI